MRKNMSILLVSVLCICIFATGCGNNGTDSETDRGKHRLTRGGNIETYVEQTEQTTESEEKTEEDQVQEEYYDYKITYSNAKTWINSIGHTKVQVIVEIENTGTTDLYLSSGSCDLEDEEGNLVSVMQYVSTYPDVISPGEKGYMYEEKTLDNYYGNGSLTVIARPDIEESCVDYIRYDVSDVSLNDNRYGTFDIIGRITNTSNKVCSMIYVAAIFYDDNNIPIGSGFTIITDDVDQNEKAGFEIKGTTFPDWITKENVSNYTIYAYPM